MCLIFVGWRAHPRYCLVVAANRDEFHARPTAPAALWEAGRRPGQPAPVGSETGSSRVGAESPAMAARAGGPGAGEAARRCILAGRDLVAGGTWLGVTADGRFAALTNYPGGAAPRPDAPSRGRLAVEYLRSGLGARAHAREVARGARSYNGFSLLLADRDELFCVTNGGDEVVTQVAEGCHGLGNDLLDAPWPKVTSGVRDLRALLGRGFATEDLFALLAGDESSAGGETHPGDSGALGRTDSVRFIRDPVYGTRSSTVVRIERSGAIAFEERTYDAGALEIGRVAFRRPSGEKEGFSPAPLPPQAEAAR